MSPQVATRSEMGARCTRMAQIAPASDAGADLLLDAQECIDAGEYAEAHELLHKVLAVDLRCLDAHALLGERNLRSTCPSRLRRNT